LKAQITLQQKMTKKKKKVGIKKVNKAKNSQNKPK
jgi:hypothetical protein